MSSPGTQAPVVVIPTKAQDQPSWTRVGVIAAVGFAIGIAWPRLAGVRLGPSLPDGFATAAASVAPGPDPAASSTLPAPGPVPAGAMPPAAPTAPAGPVTAPGVSASAAAEQLSPNAPADRFKAVQVKWEVALVRDAPKTGKVVAHLPRGTTIRIGPQNEGWFPVRYGDGLASEGWVYRGAVGR